jgi:DNA polymerase I
MDIKTLVEEDGFICRYQADTYNGTYSSPCPWCGGKDRFRCFPNNGNGGNYFCQKCGKKGSVLRYLTEYRGMDYSAAIKLSGHVPQQRNSSLRTRLLKMDNDFKDPSDPPCNIWQQQASGLIQVAADNIWHKNNVGHLDWLMKRGLTASTIRKYQIGFNCANIYPDRSVWGIDVPNSSSNKMIVPAGIVIPHINNGVIQKIKIRRFDPQAKNKYHLLAGSNSSVMVLGSGICHIVVESELDGILLAQEAGDLVTVIVLGSANNRPDSAVMEQLVNSGLVLLALDNDKAGIESSYHWWIKTVPNAKRWAILKGKDPGESYQNGVNIRYWVKAGLLTYIPSLKLDVTGNPKKENKDINIQQQLERLARLAGEKAIFINVVTTGDDPFKESIKEIHLSGSGSSIFRLKGEKILERARKELAAIFSTNNYKIFYNAKPQLKFLINHDFNVTGHIFDQKLSKQLIYNGTVNVEDQISIDVMKSSNKKLVSDIQQYGLREVSILESECVPVIVQIELNGMLIDKEAVNELLSELKKHLIPLKADLHLFLGEINLDSHKELKTALISKGISVQSTKKKMLIPLLKKYPIFMVLIEYRRIKGNIQKCNEILRNINPDTGRVHPVYNQIVNTGRMSCSKPNIHSIPKKKEFRRLFIAPEGSAIIRADFSQIELRVAAEISNDNRMRAAFKNGQDLHRLTASLIMNKSIDQISDDERQRAKPVNFGLLFDMSAQGLQEYAMTSYQVFLPIEEAEIFRNRFLSGYQGFAQWQQKQRFKVETRTLSERRRIWKDQVIRPSQLLNSPIQGTAADILKKSLVILSDALMGKDAKIIGTIHDEILVKNSNENVEKIKSIVEHSMIKAGKCYLKSVPVEVDVSDSNTWQ